MCAAHPDIFAHLSVGDLLKQEAQKGGPRGEVITQIIRDGQLVPLNVCGFFSTPREVTTPADQYEFAEGSCSEAGAAYRFLD